MAALGLDRQESICELCQSSVDTETSAEGSLTSHDAVSSWAGLGSGSLSQVIPKGNFLFACLWFVPDIPGVFQAQESKCDLFCLALIL